MKLLESANIFRTTKRIATYLSLVILVLHQFGHLATVICLQRSSRKSGSQIGETDTNNNHNNNDGSPRSDDHHDHHHHHHSSSNSNNNNQHERYRRPGHTNHHQAQNRRLHARALASYEPHSRINSSESLSSAWFYQQDQPAILDQCCACDEAKYELVFEGLWSKYTHPDDFPENYWLAYFSDIIGASHSNDFQMWAKDSLASEGVKELAETGSTKKLESELKHVSSKTRTIIKARELRDTPTLNSKTSAVFRTDKHHHLVSILSKLGPSPDWMVGVSSLELCQLDCTWAPQRVVNLHLWDAGTDSGSSFTASDMPSQPQERIHPYHRRTAAAAASSPAPNGDNQFNMGSNGDPAQQQQQQRPSESYGQFNGDSVYAGRDQRGSIGARQTYQSAAANNGGEQSMLPPMVDDLGLSSSSAYYQSSNPTPNNSNNNNNNNYRASLQQDQVKPFARLTVTRQRIYEKSCNGGSSATNAELSTTTLTRPSSFSQLNQKQEDRHHNHLHPTINSDTLIEPMNRPTYSDCRFTDWSDWSSCSSNCGKGIRTRTRSFLDDQAHLAGCSQSDLIEKEICLAECIGNASCVTRDWSEWSKCSVNCGQGFRKRTRSLISNSLKQACSSIELAEMEACTGDCNDPSFGGGNGEHPTQPGAGTHCAVTEWSQWSECSVACGKGTKIRTRQFVNEEGIENCGHVKLLQKQSCNGRPELCKQIPNKGNNPNGQQSNQSQQPNRSPPSHHPNPKQTNYDLPVIDCKLSNWSPWSTCSALCGNGRRTRSRYIIQMPQNGGKPCDKKLTRTQKCKDLPPCPQDYMSNQDSNINSGSGGGSGSSGGGSGKNAKSNQNQMSPGSSYPIGSGFHRTTTTTTTSSSSMMDDEDDSKFSRSLRVAESLFLITNPTQSISFISDGAAATSTEMELLGSSSFHIRNGQVYPFGNLKTS